MARKTQIGKLVIDLQIKTQALEQGLNTAKQKLKEIESSNKSLEDSNKSIDASYVAMSAAVIGALVKINSTIKDCINEYNKYTQAMSGLENIANYTGQDINKLNQIMQKFSKMRTCSIRYSNSYKKF